MAGMNVLIGAAVPSGGVKAIRRPPPMTTPAMATA
jgi:hypothetical protein